MNLPGKVFLALLLFATPVFAGLDGDEVDDFVTMANESNYDFNLTDKYSIALWANIASTQSGQSVLVAKGLVAAEQYVGYDLILSGDSDAQGGSALMTHIVSDWGAADRIQVYGSTEQLDDNAWHHLAYTYDGSGNASGVSFYVDGVGETENIRLDTLTGSILNNHPFRLFMRHDGGADLEGIIGEIAVWSVELSAAEVSRLASAESRHMPLQIQAAGLVSYHTLDDEEDGTSADGDTFLDYSGNGNTATGDDGANNTGLTARAEEVLSYP